MFLVIFKIYQVCQRVCVYLRSQVEVTVHRQHWSYVVSAAEGKQFVAGVLEVFLQEQLSR